VKGARLWRVAALVWTLVIIVFGVVPTRGVVHEVARGHGDLLTSAAHFGEFVLYAFVLAVAIGGWRRDWRALSGAALIAVGLGVAVELVQALLPYRDAQIGDALVDVVGVAVGLLAFSLAAGMRARQRPSHRG
jgi:VanZ family protein